MIAKTRFIAYIVAATAAMAAAAADYVWTGAAGDGDWTNPLNFTLDGSAPDAIPGADDKVSIPADTTVTLYYDRSIEAKKASCEAFAAVGWISPADDSSVIDITVPENATLTLACAIATRASTTPANLKGTVVKRGRGTVALASNALLTSGSTCFDYATTLDVAGGVLRLPATANDRYCAVRKICVRSGATLEVQSNMSVFDRLDSEAESSITNIVPETRWFVMREGSNGAVAGEVSGMTSFDVHSGRLSLVGGNNTFDGDVIHVRGNDGTISPDAPGTLSVLKFGVKADGNGVKSASSIGHAETVLIETQGGGLRYLGSGETTDKTIALKSSRDDFGFIDAGPQGGIEFAGDITMQRESTIDFSMKRLVLTGSNAAPATISGTIAAPMTSQFGKTNYTFRITKRGTGVWKMLHNDSSDMRGVFAVNEGTLAFDTLAEKGVNSALGKSTILQEDVAGVKVNPGAYGVDYAFLLGGGGRGSLEYVGSTNCASSTRLFTVDGEGAIVNNGSGFLRLADFNALRGTGSATLVLGGSNALENVADDIRDGDGSPLSVVKEGEGSWRIGTNLAFTGSLVVKSGRLTVGLPPYTWYRWTLKGNFYTPESSANGARGSSTERVVGAMSLGLFDAAGTDQAAGLDDIAYFSRDANGRYVNKALVYSTLPGVFGASTSSGAFVSLEPGECRLAESGAHAYQTATTVASLFDGSGGTYFGMWDRTSACQLIPVPTNSTSWRVIEMRLPTSANPVTSYDFVSLADDGNKQNIQYATLEGSVNGLDWDVLDEYGTNACPSSGATWRKTGAPWPDVAGTPHFGFPIATTPSDGQSFQASSVRVDAGGTLVSCAADALSVPCIEIDAGGMGVLKGFALAEGGTIRLVNPRPEREYVVSADFTGTILPASYGIVVDGLHGKRLASMSPDRMSIRVRSRGTVLLIK